MNIQIVSKSKAKPRGARGASRATAPLMRAILESIQKLKPGQVMEIAVKDTHWLDIAKARTGITGLINRARTPNAADEVDLAGEYSCYATEDKKHVGVECISLEEE